MAFVALSSHSFDIGRIMLTNSLTSGCEEFKLKAFQNASLPSFFLSNPHRIFPFNTKASVAVDGENSIASSNSFKAKCFSPVLKNPKARK